MVTANDYAELNLPGGEVYTAPRPDSVEGEVLFDKPLVRHGREIDGARLVFEDGRVVEYGADKNEDVLGEILDTDEGAKRLGELGIGMNRDIDEFTYNMLFDEKMGDTIHLAIGKAIEHTVPDGEPLNESATHVDMIVDMSEDSFIEVDGEIVQRNGTFRFEEDSRLTCRTRASTATFSSTFCAVRAERVEWDRTTRERATRGPVGRRGVGSAFGRVMETERVFEGHHDESHRERLDDEEFLSERETGQKDADTS